MTARYIDITCRNCNSTQKYPHVKLATYYGKSVSLPCKQCGAIQKMEVNAYLLNQAQNGNKEFETKIISRGEQKATIHRIASIQVIPNADTTGQLIELKEGTNILGRKSHDQHPDKREIETGDKQMSRSHCVIMVEKRGGAYKYTLKDYPSRLGTFLNKEKMREGDEVYINENDLVRLGSTSFKLKI